MVAQATSTVTMNPVPIDPWAFELPEYLLRVSVSAGETRAYGAELRPDEFYEDDQHITAAALELHPLLGDEPVAALLGSLSPADPDVHYGPGTLLPELGESKDPAIHLMIAGRARLVITFRANGEERRRVRSDSAVQSRYGADSLDALATGGSGSPSSSARSHA